ncbi:DNA-binding protein Ikaros-like [Ornithodoros turicata]|uniref:DNA-binding protein Ikaros-like n=1 Tax=Ornithodoros turicata TaxID=34597 RepID=UPI0031395FD1
MYRILRGFEKLEAIDDFFRESHLSKSQLLVNVSGVDEASDGNEIVVKAKCISEEVKDSVVYNVRFERDCKEVLNGIFDNVVTGEQKENLFDLLKVMRGTRTVFHYSILTKMPGGSFMAGLLENIKERTPLFAPRPVIPRETTLHLCSFCPCSSKLKANVVAHERTHTGERPFKCRFCSYAAAMKDTLRLHERRHTGERPFNCTLCPYAAMKKQHLTSHMEHRHKMVVKRKR